MFGTVSRYRSEDRAWRLGEMISDVVIEDAVVLVDFELALDWED